MQSTEVMIVNHYREHRTVELLLFSFLGDSFLVIYCFVF